LSAQESTTFERLRAILAQKFEVAPELIDPAARMDQLGIDSLAVIEVIFQIEDEFKISIQSDPGELQTLADLVACVDRLAEEQRGERASAGAARP
jgi:acyl carrier protein